MGLLLIPSMGTCLVFCSLSCSRPGRTYPRGPCGYGGEWLLPEGCSESAPCTRVLSRPESLQLPLMVQQLHGAAGLHNASSV